MRRRSRPLLGIAAVAIALTLSGCSTNTQALTVGKAAKATKAAVAPVDASKNVLTTAQAKAALPAATELGKKWIKGSATLSSGSSKSTGTYSPAKCAFSSSNGQLKGLEASPGKAIATAKASFKTKNSAALSFDGTVIEVKSFKDGIDTSTFTKIRKVLGECKKFTYTDGSGVTSDFRILPLSLPKYGDQTLAFRMQATVSMFVLVIDFVEVANGHNLVSIYQAGLGGLDTTATGKAVDATMKGLDEATKAS